MPTYFNVLGEAEIDTSKAEASADRLQRRIRDVGRAGAEAGQSASEKFGDLNSVFGGLLPRNMQSIIRRFQSTSRAVRRAGRSMSIFKKSIVALGLPALIILIGELVANWEAFTDLLGITSEESRRAAKEQEELNRVMMQATASTQPYVDVLLDMNRALEDRQIAQAQLARSVQAVAGIDMDAADAVERITAATEAYLQQQRLRKEQEQIQARIDEAAIETKEKLEELNETSWRQSSRQYRHLENEYNKALQAQTDLEGQRAGIIDDIIAQQRILNEEMERQRQEREAAAQAERDAQQAEREAEAARQKAQREREARLEREADAIARREKQAVQTGMTEEELFLDELERQEQAELATVKSEEAKAAIREFYAQKFTEYMNERSAAEQARLDQEAQKEADALARRTEQAQKAVTDAEEKAFQERNQADMTARERELMENEQYYNALLDQADEFGLDTTQLLEDRRLKEKEINDKYNAEEVEAEKQKQEALKEAKLRAVGEAASLVNDMGKLAEEGTATAKGLAVTEVLLNQAVAMSEAIKGANKAAAAGGPAAPFLQVGYMLSMVGGVVSSFASIKRILSDADAAGGASAVGSGGGGGRTMASPLVPQQNFDVENNAGQNVNVSAYVVQSQLQGQQLDQASAMSRATL